MAPRSGKRRHRTPPIPVWIPLPRPCLRSLNLPGPYYMPVPEMYLPWALPPPYFTKPICHCANKNFCTSNTCLDPAECLKRRPMYCSHAKELDLEQTIHEDEENIDQDTSSANVCTSCGASLDHKIMTSNITNKTRENVQVPTSRVQRDDSFSSSYSSEQTPTQDPSSGTVPYKWKTTALKHVNTPDNGILNENTPNFLSPRQLSNGCTNSSCQTQGQLDNISTNTPSERRNSGRNPSIVETRRAKKKTNSTSSYAADSETSFDHNEVPSSDTQTSKGNGVDNDTESHSIPVKLTSNSNNKSNNATMVPHNKTANEMHLNLPDHLSQARRETANTNRCCKSPGSTSSCKMQMADKTAKDKPHKASSKTRISKCSSTKINKSKSSSKIKSICECSSTKIYNKASSKSIRVSDCSCSVVKLVAKKSSKTLKRKPSPSAKSPRASSCECRFPPAYKHLSCSGQTSGNCSCSQPSKTSE